MPLLHVARKWFRRGDFVIADMGTPLIVFAHVVTKVVVDFTAWLSFRAPLVMGGGFFTINLVWNQLTTVVVAYAYISGAGSDEDENRLESTVVVNVTLAANVMVLLSFTALIMVIESDFIKTFTSFATEADHSNHLFRLHTEPELKLASTILFTPERNWFLFREELKEYIGARLKTWEGEKPLWYVRATRARLAREKKVCVLMRRAKEGVSEACAREGGRRRVRRASEASTREGGC
jgi:hypothetical protein